MSNEAEIKNSIILYVASNRSVFVMCVWFMCMDWRTVNKCTYTQSLNVNKHTRTATYDCRSTTAYYMNRNGWQCTFIVVGRFFRLILSRSVFMCASRILFHLCLCTTTTHTKIQPLDSRETELNCFGMYFILRASKVTQFQFVVSFFYLVSFSILNVNVNVIIDIVRRSGGHFHFALIVGLADWMFKPEIF